MNLPGLNQRKYRDLSLIDLDGERTLVIACDSSGAVGPKPLDVVHVSGYVLGRFTARVTLMEVVAAGASPICVVNTLCVEPHPSGEEICLGIADEIRELGLDPEKLLTGSMEKNMPTSQSGLGVTVIGIAEKKGLKIGALHTGDCVALIGIPKVGGEVSLADQEIADLHTVCALINDPTIKEIVPIGSRGVLAEAQDLAHIYGLELRVQECTIDLNKSAGPSTCLLAVGNQDSIKNICNTLFKPYNLIGKLV
ncbi:MAG TPA: AIR synthase related protein [Candidatus Deferrimicrobium sp.]|nr:AIR synthase related protein [Candidatus Deferrimicrobium sp.]